MKKIILLSSLLAFTFAFSFAQSFHFGLKGGADLHKINGESFKSEFNLGYNAGVFAEIGLPGKIGLQPEVYYSQVNPETRDGFTAIYGSFKADKIKLSYLNIPILINFKVAPMLSLQVGPQFGILINKDKDLEQNGQDAFKSGDAGVAAGLQINAKKIKVFARYVAGIKDVDDSDRGKWRNQTIHLGIGFRLF